MKNSLKVIILIIMLFVLASCTNSSQARDDSMQYEIYKLAKQDGYEGTYEEWLNSIKGEAGEDAREIELIVENGILKWKYKDSQTSYVLFNLNTLQGESGKQIELSVQNGYLMWRYVDGGSQWLQLYKISALKGEAGVGIESIKKTHTEGLVDTYTITYTNGTTSSFTVTNGKSIQGEKGEDGHTPVITIENGYWCVDGVNTNCLAEGVQGEKGEQGEAGTDGLSAYEIYIKYHPEYTGTEEEWLNDLVNGNLREKYTVSFNTNGGTDIEDQKISYGHLVTRPYDPEKEGYVFDGWYLNGEIFPFNSYQVYDNIRLVARWKSEILNVSLKVDGGSVEYNSKTVVYGTSYTLPTPTKENYIFDGWYDENMQLCNISGIWDFSKEDVTLTAKWSGTKVNAVEISDENVENGFGSFIINYGESYTLPVPNILSGDTFIGWADTDGVLYTDSNGNSLAPSSFKEDIELKAIYYIMIESPEQLIKLNTYAKGSKELSRTYVLKNDLDFTGLQTESIEYFEGVLDGKGYKIIGLSNSLFGTIGTTNSTGKEIAIRNIIFKNFSGKAIAENVLNTTTCIIENIKITSFVKDENNYVGFYGIVAKVGNIESKLRPNSLIIKNCHVQDEYATVETGIVNRIEYYKNINISFCSNYANCKSSAIVSEDYFSDIDPRHFTSYPASAEMTRGLLQNAYENIHGTYDLATILKISYCANYGDCKTMITAASSAIGDYRYDTYYDYDSTDTHRVYIDNCVNYGTVSYCLFKNSLVSKTRATRYAGDNSYYKEASGFFTSFLNGGFKVTQCMNFGKVYSIFGDVQKSETEDVVYAYTANYIFNCGETTKESTISNYGLDSFYEVIPYTIIDETMGLNITSIGQITSGFFEDIFGLNTEYWDLSYIKIDDEYGLPQIDFSSASNSK